MSCDDGDHFLGFIWKDGGARCIYRHYQYDPAELIPFDWCPNCGEALTERAIKQERPEPRISVDAAEFQALKERAKDHPPWRTWMPWPFTNARRKTHLEKVRMARPLLDEQPSSRLRNVQKVTGESTVPEHSVGQDAANPEAAGLSGEKSPARARGAPPGRE